MKNKVTIFDFDGVIIDSIPLAKEHTKSLYVGLTDEQYKRLHSGNYHVEIAKAAHLKRAQTEEETLLDHKEYMDKKLETPLCSGVETLLHDLHHLGYILTVNTSAYGVDTVPLLEKHNISSLFDFIGTAEISKSKVEKFKIIEEKYGARKEDIVFITDALGDVKEAKTAGIATIGVTWGAHDKETLREGSYDNLIDVVDSVEELEDAVATYFKK